MIGVAALSSCVKSITDTRPEVMSAASASSVAAAVPAFAGACASGADAPVSTNATHTIPSLLMSRLLGVCGNIEHRNLTTTEDTENTEVNPGQTRLLLRVLCVLRGGALHSATPSNLTALQDRLRAASSAGREI